MPHIVICQRWSAVTYDNVFSAREYGSLHIDAVMLARFIDTYWRNLFPEMPDSYVTVSKKGDKTVPPYRCAISANAYQRVFDSQIGLWSRVIPQEAENAVTLIRDYELTSLLDGVRL